MIRLASLLLVGALAFPVSTFAAERIVSIPGGDAPLFGTLETPEVSTEPRPAVLILPGSGPTDRDGNSLLGPSPNELKQLADALAAAGLASVRIDKRGVGASARASPPETDLRLSTYVGDAQRWAAWLRRQPGVPCVVLAGHSEGALIAILAAKSGEVCGLVSLEGPGRPLAEVLRDQLNRALQEPLRAKALAVLDKLSRGALVEDPPSELARLFRTSVQPYLISELSVDPAAEIKTVPAPILLIQGDADQQVSRADFERLKSARPEARAVLIRGMTHPLKLEPSVGRPVGLTNAPLAPGVSEAIAGFVKGLQSPSQGGGSP